MHNLMCDTDFSLPQASESLFRLIILIQKSNSKIFVNVYLNLPVIKVGQKLFVHVIKLLNNENSCLIIIK